MDNKPKVFIGVPTMGHVHVDLCSRLISWIASGKIRGVVHASVCVTPVDHARNEIVRKFLKSDCDFLFFVDDDTVPPAETIEKLLALSNNGEKPIVTGLTPILKRQPEGGYATMYNAFTHVTELPNGDKQMHCPDENTGPVKVVRAGGSCLIIHRSVFLKLGDSPFRIMWNADYTSYTGEDLSFCDLAVEKGLEIWADTSVICGHYKPVML